jgi:hypothetical protein
MAGVASRLVLVGVPEDILLGFQSAKHGCLRQNR